MDRFPRPAARLLLLLSSVCLTAQIPALPARAEDKPRAAHAHHHATAKPAAKPTPAAKPDAAVPAAPPAPQAAAPAQDRSKGSNTGLPLPRFAALRSDDVDMRVGPGQRYPILWVYKRRDLPVEIIREFDAWRLVVTQDGTKGWVHQATLTGRRTFQTLGDQTIRDAAADAASPVAILRDGATGKLKACEAQAAWCQVQARDYRGWLPRTAFWGIEAGEAVQ